MPIALAALAVLALVAPAATPVATSAPASPGVPGAAEVESWLAGCWRSAVAQPSEALLTVEAQLGRVAGLEERAELVAAVAELCLCRGYVHEQLGQLDLAALDYQRAVEDGERRTDRKLLASALALRGELAYYRGAFTAALEDLDRAYRIELELGRRSRQLYILTAIANLYADARFGAYDRAIDYYRQVLAAHEASGSQREIATAHFNLGSTFERKGDLAAALAEFERAVALDRERGDRDEVAVDERALAAVLIKLGRAREALPALERSVARFAATGDQESLAQARLTRGIARRVLGDAAGALADLDAAGERFRRQGNERYLVRVEEERAEALAARGDLAGAFRARTAQVALERKLAEVTRDEHTSRLRVEFDSEKKEAEAEALARESELRGRALADAVRIRTLQRWVLALGGVLLLLVAALALRQVARARRLHRLAMTDELTRLPNRRALFALAGEQLAAARRANAPFSVLALDIDHFKRINDGHGHETGDRVLQRVAHAARAALRAGDSVGRIGGEEFLALLPATPLDAAVEIAERLRAAVAALDAGDLAPGLAVTVSVGVAERGDESAIDAVARRADEVLYRAKAGGRNRVEVAAGEASDARRAPG